MLIAKRFTFDAAHRLTTLPETHKCHRLHGHTYECEIRLMGLVGSQGVPGFIVDYQEIADAWLPIHEKLDHRYLNDVPGLSVPSTEVLVAWIAREWENGPLGAHRAGLFLHSVKLAESSTTWAEWRSSSDG